MPRPHSGPRHIGGWRSGWRDPMPSRNFTATRQPRDIGLVLGAPLLDGLTRFRIQNVDSNARLFVRESRTMPMANHRPHIVEPGDWYGPFLLYAVDELAVRGVWAWSDQEACSCVVTAIPQV